MHLNTPVIPAIWQTNKQKIPWFRGCRDGSAVKKMYCSCRGPEFNSQHPNGDSQAPVIPALEDLTHLYAYTHAN